MTDRHSKDKKKLGFYVNKEVCKDFSDKLAIDGIEQTELLQTAINSYLYGKSHTRCKSGTEIVITIEVK